MKKEKLCKNCKYFGVLSPNIYELGRQGVCHNRKNPSMKYDDTTFQKCTCKYFKQNQHNKKD